MRTLPSWLGSNRSKFTVTKMPPSTPALATTILSWAPAVRLALNTNSGTSRPVPSAFSLSLMKKPSKINSGLRKPLSTNF